MKKILRLAGLGVACLVFLGLLTALVARRLDGPLGPLAGGSLRTGAFVEEPVLDWSFASEAQTIEMQLLTPPRSRTTWILVRDGQAYIPCGAPSFRLLKQWPHEAMRDGRAIVRIGGRRHPVILARINDAETTADLDRVMRTKYPVSTGGPSEVWYFRLDPAGEEVESP